MFGGDGMDTDEMVRAVLDSTSVQDAENVISSSDTAIRYNKATLVHLPEDSEAVVIDIRSIKKIQTICASAKEVRRSYAEIFLALASLFIGTFLSALISQMPYELTARSIFFYNISLVLGVAFAVAYYFTREKALASIRDFAERIEENLDLGPTNKVLEENNEHK